MENQHRKISGYRELSQEEIDLMNKIKDFGPLLKELVAELEEYINEKYSTDDIKVIDELDEADPYLWVESGKSRLQEGLMFLTRAVAQPKFF